MSIFAGALTDKFDKKKTMLACDLLAAVSTVLVFILYLTGNLTVWHLYVINAFSGLMNTVQQPASEVATTLLIPNPKGGSSNHVCIRNRWYITLSDIWTENEKL